MATTRWLVRQAPLSAPDVMLAQAKTEELTLDAVAVYIDPQGDVQLVAVFTETTP